MDVLVDTDAIIKLAQYSLLNEFDRLLRGKGWPPPYFCTKEALHSSRIFSRLAVADERERANVERAVKAFIRASKSVPVQSAIVDQLDYPDIDVGERILLAHLIANADSLLLTGDKRFVNALATNPKLSAHCAALPSRIMHIERLLVIVCDHFSWKSVRKKIDACPGADIAIAGALGSPFSDAQARINLSASASALEARSAGLLSASF